MRLFIGIPFSERVRNRIRQEVVRIGPFIAKGKLSSWEGYHITLKFLGEVSEPKMGELALQLEAAKLDTVPFELSFTELGAFRKSGGDVLWLGLDMPPALLKLQQEVEAMAVRSGFEPDGRPYVPHLTLGRGIRYTETFDKAAMQWSLKNLEDQVDRVVLFHSTQVEGKLAYVPLFTKLLSHEQK